MKAWHPDHWWTDTKTFTAFGKKIGIALISQHTIERIPSHVTGRVFFGETDRLANDQYVEVILSRQSDGKFLIKTTVIADEYNTIYSEENEATTGETFAAMVDQITHTLNQLYLLESVQQDLIEGNRKAREAGVRFGLKQNPNLPLLEGADKEYWDRQRGGFEFDHDVGEFIRRVNAKRDLRACVL